MKRIFLSTIILVLLLTIISLNFSAYPRVNAESLLQETPSFEGLNIYFTEAGGEASRFDRSDNGLSRFAGLLRQSGANLYTLEWRSVFPSDADLIVVAGPATDLTPDQIARLWSYVNNNGRLLILAEPLIGSKALPFNSGLFQLTWGDMGFRARGDVVVKPGSVENTAASEATEEPLASQPALVANFTALRFDGNHPITQGLQDELSFTVARSIEYDAAIQGYTVTPLVFTDNTFYGETAYDAFLKDGSFTFNIGSDTTQGALALAVAFDNPRTRSRVVLIGDRQFATNGGGFKTSPPYSASFLYPGNVRFMMRSAAWLLERPTPEDMTFPTPGPTATVTITPSPTLSPTPTATATPG